MIKFFRRIRQSLLIEGKTGKYLKYAIGEIILVVIGILIALGINNWNEETKINASVTSHLTILQQNLMEDQSQLKELKQRMTENIHYADSSMLQIRTTIPVANSIKKYLVKLILEYKFSPNTNAMEMLTQSNELPYLNTNLQTAILNYYSLIEKVKEREYISNTQIQTKYENHLNNTYPEVFQKDNEWEFIKSFYQSDPRPTLAVEEQKLLNDRTLEPLLVSRYFQSVALQDFYGELITSSQTILELIEQHQDR
ncbi:hypothetical protein OE09_0998 [Flavobacteriaceae bacterium MAR_2010_72]|nr:hypothetical protein OE09_0998 [Flavobacteriaceae bacterium MAR_2010_72]